MKHIFLRTPWQCVVYPHGHWQYRQTHNHWTESRCRAYDAFGRGTRVIMPYDGLRAASTSFSLPGGLKALPAFAQAGVYGEELIVFNGVFCRSVPARARRHRLQPG